MAERNNHGATHTMPGRRVHDLLDEALRTHAEVPAVRDQHGRWTYRELHRHSIACADWLRGQGVRPGDRILVQSASTRELVALCYATSRLGAVFVPINPATRAYHLRSILDDAEPVLVLLAEPGDTAALTQVPVHATAVVWSEVAAIAAAGPSDTPAADLSADAVATLVYTSGSTAAPKAVICAHDRMVFASEAIQAVLGYRDDDVVFCRFPISWDYGLYKILLTCLGRSELVLAGDESDLRLLSRMRETGATVVPIVPSLATMIAGLAEREQGPLPPVRMFTNTGAALAASTIAALRTAFPGVRVVRQFGQTECKRISIMPVDEDEQRPDSVGRPLPGTTVLILDPDGEPVPTGEVGEIVAAGPHVMPGYWRAPELTARTFRRGPDGVARLHTGDYGRLDADGYLYFEGRRDDMFKRKGIRMSTTEIEAAALDVPGVRAAAAVPPGPGRDLALCVESELPPQVILRELARRLEPAKVPATCLVLDELPLTKHGKNARANLVQLLERSDA
ncbi:AMP-binding protein [Micromonospora sp. FIMYZ51]|uniref:AMP-binding protein n=1 Tax=Micromonospora sp. FIMYZ51 TaxID=3051832 RepID=UPI00312039B6